MSASLGGTWRSGLTRRSLKPLCLGSTPSVPVARLAQRWRIRLICGRLKVQLLRRALRVLVAQLERADASEASGRTFDSCREHLVRIWQSSYSVVSSVEASRRTASSAATEPGDARHAFRRSGRRQNAGWFTGPSLRRSRANDSARLDDGLLA